MGSKIQVKAGRLPIGGGAEVSVQSMLNVPSTDIEGSVRQAKALEAAGCQVIRAAIPDMDAVRLIPALKEAVEAPIVADIHFNYKLALEACAAGVDKIRINPGNIGSDDRVKAVADACRLRGIPIRIGVNSGSLEKEILAKYGHPTAEALCDSALYHASLLEKFDFTDIVLSMKSSTVSNMIAAYELAAQRCDYPLHLGVTEAGTERMGIIKSAAGIGSLLLRGIVRGIRYPQGARHQKGRSAVRVLSHLRQNEDRPCRNSERGRGKAARLQEEYQGSRYGLRCERSRRGKGSRYRHCRRRRLRTGVQKGRGAVQGARGAPCGRSDGRDREAVASRSFFQPTSNP